VDRFEGTVVEHLSPLSWSQFLQDFSWKVDAALEQAADAIKDAILDWSAPAEGAKTLEPLQLPALSREAFAQAMRARVEESLKRVADAINEAPRGEVVDASQERVQDLFAELCCEALLLGLRMRANAIQPALRPTPDQPHDWAVKFRLMQTGEPPFPFPKDPITGEREEGRGPPHEQ
jgi:hypothetical protein